MKDDKPSYRAPYFRDFYKTLLTVSSGAAIASVTFIENAKSTIHIKWFFYIGFTLILSSIIFQLLIPFLNVLGHGYHWDETHSELEMPVRSEMVGTLVSDFMVGSMLLTIFGVVFLSLFVGWNVS